MWLLAPILAGVTYFVNPFPLDTLGTQSVAMVRGAVIDNSSRKPIAGAVVYAVSSETGAQTAISNAAGHFYFLALPPGHYGFFVDKRLDPDDCSVLQRASELNAGFEYLATIYVGRGCHKGP